MSVRDLLNECRTAVIEIAAIERQRDRVMSIGGPKEYSGAWPTIAQAPGGGEHVFAPRGTNDAEAARQQQADGLTALLDQRCEQLEAMLIQFERLLRQLDDGTARTILRYYYGVAWTDDRIADEIEMPRQTVNARRHAAVSYLETLA